MMNKKNIGSISSSDLIDSRFEEQQFCGSKKCPSCGHKLDGKPDWVGLPAGVKFDPTDQELIEHLEAKVFVKDIKSHPLIDEFIPTIDGEDGICYTHPQKLPGVTRDGLSRHFFHRPSKAYTTGTRKRRKIIQTEPDQNRVGSSSLSSAGETRWHKTGKTRPVMVTGRQKGCKKILVLYTNFGKNRKPEKTNWVMHQYHLGQHEEEKEGELVVSKIFYQTQPRQCNWSSERSLAVAGDGITAGAGDLDASSRVPFGVTPSYGLDSGFDHNLSFLPFRKGFQEVGVGEASTAREGHVHGTCDEMYHGSSSSSHHHHPTISAAFHISRPSHPISTIISPSSLHHHHHHLTSINVLEESSYHLPRIMLPNASFQTQEEEEQEQEQNDGRKMRERDSSGLEELIMGCTSSTDGKQSSSIQNPQETEWLKYSSFWPATDPNNQDHHG